MGHFEEIDIHEAKKMIDDGAAVLVDVRGKESFDDGHITGAVYVDDSNIEDFVKNTDKSKPLVCYCHMGISSKSAAQHFKDNGFEKVYSMIGGITEWHNDYADLIKTSGEA